jgi:hypothetical protein
MAHRHTQLLLLIILLAAGACAWGYSRMDAEGEAAAIAQRNLLEAKQSLGEIVRAKTSGAPTATANLDVSELNRRLRDAASTAGISEKLVSIEPGQPNRIPNTDYNEMQVFLRFEPLSLKQLVTFLHELGTADHSSRAKSIELGTPAAASGTEAGAGAGDIWSAEVTMAYLIYSPREEGT